MPLKSNNANQLNPIYPVPNLLGGLIRRSVASAAAITFMSLIGFLSPSVHAANPTPFNACKACHAIGPTANHGIGPQLNNVFGRKIGASAGFKFSPAMVAAGKSGRTWDEESLDKWLKDPAAFLPGSRMVLKVDNPNQRAALIAWLKSQQNGISRVSVSGGDPEVAPDVLAIAGDPNYGEYLAGSCIACHQADGSNQGIPSITGWPVIPFVTAMQAYKSKARQHPIMQTIAGALNDEEIAGLAAWFEAQ